MILQQRELRLQRQWSQKSRGKRSVNVNVTEKERFTGPQGGYWGWRNVAAAPDTEPMGPEVGNLSKGGLAQADYARTDRVMSGGLGPSRTRSRTNPERLGTGPMMRRRSQRSNGRTSHPPVRQSFDGAMHAGVGRMSGAGKYARPSFERW